MSADGRGGARRSVSFAGSHQDLPGDIPQSFKEAAPAGYSFALARDPYISMQLRDMERGETGGRGSAGRGSEMVKRERPFPELHPANQNAPKRTVFNNAWLREHRAARMASFEKQYAATRIEQERLLSKQPRRERLAHGPER